MLLYGNLLLFGVTFLSLVLLIGGMHAKSTASFLQAVYGSLIGKLFICGIAAFVYFKTATELNKPSIFVLLGLYLLYTFFEIRSILQLTKDIKNAKTTGTA
jgi:phosphotransferase system  glucose/maltose/N-acetylglucosamine-specific IIC component